MARNALNRPVPASVHSIGEKIAETSPIKASSGLSFFLVPLSPESAPRPGRSLVSSS